MRFFNWVKTHKLLIVLALVIAFLLRNSLPIYPRPLDYGYQTQSIPSGGISVGMSSPSYSKVSSDTGFAPASYTRVSESSQRVVIQESSLSLLVKNVRETGDRIISTAKGMGGYMVNVSYNNPEESAFATVSIRVPTDRLDEALNQFRGLAIKVTNENLVGTDVTQEYQDLDQRITTLKTTKTKFEEILKRATTVDEILRVNTEIINLESQIDQATGQKMALADNARLTKITIFLSTDELALPYTPDKVFRPDVVFKLAVRSLLSTLQGFAEFIIWLGVFSVIWIPLIVIIIFIKKRMQKSKYRQNSSSGPSLKN